MAPHLLMYPFMGTMLPRRQHPGFGTELRALINSNKVEDREKAGIVIRELDALARFKAMGQGHPHEKSMGDDMRGVSCIKLEGRYSIRIYFTVVRGVIYPLHLDDNKRRTNMLDAARRLIIERLHYVRQDAGERG